MPWLTMSNRCLLLVAGCTLCTLSAYGQERLRLSTQSEYGVTNQALSADGKYYAAISVDGKMSVWTVPEFELVRNTKFLGTIAKIAFAGKSKHLVVAFIQDGTTTLRWYDFRADAFTKEDSFAGLVRVLHEDQFAVLFLLQNKKVRDAKVAVRDLRERRDYLVEITAGKLASTHIKEKSRAIDLCLDRNEIAWAATDGKVVTYDYKNRRIRREFEADQHTQDVIYHPDGKTLLTYRAPVMTVWDLGTGKKIREPIVPGQRLLPDGRHAVWQHRDDWVFTNLDGKEQKRFTFYPGRWQMHLLSITPDQRLMIGGGSAGEIRVWEIPKLKD